MSLVNRANVLNVHNLVNLASLAILGKHAICIREPLV